MPADGGHGGEQGAGVDLDRLGAAGISPGEDTPGQHPGGQGGSGSFPGSRWATTGWKQMDSHKMSNPACMVTCEVSEPIGGPHD